MHRLAGSLAEIIPLIVGLSLVRIAVISWLPRHKTLAKGTSLITPTRKVLLFVLALVSFRAQSRTLGQRAVFTCSGRPRGDIMAVHVVDDFLRWITKAAVIPAARIRAPAI